jgi:bifunctional non-homologous end joining protein LigD
MSLKKYHEKRDFLKTKEPKGDSSTKGKDIFVVQKHDASHLHYDFRLEIQGVLKSWAVPKGIPKKQAEKHLAVQTEDHPVEYAEFEGEIPKGEYGAGSVEIWDKGRYKNLKDTDIKEQLDKGRIEVFLKGKKLDGKYALINTRFNNNPKNWLIIKMKEE